MLPRVQSAGESGFLLNKLIHPFEQALFGRASSTEEQVRKAAHVFEYTCLGMGLAAYFGLAVSMGSTGPGMTSADTAAGGPNRNADAWKRRCTVLFRTLSAGMFAAFLDETIQIFSGRGPQISDVWIDGIGVLQGALLGLLILRLAGGKNQKKNCKENLEKNKNV